MIRKQGSISYIQELCPANETRRPSDSFAYSLGLDIDVPIDGKGKFGKHRRDPRDQILDVQGRLKSNMAFWKDYLGTPTYVPSLD